MSTPLVNLLWSVGFLMSSPSHRALLFLCNRDTEHVGSYITMDGSIITVDDPDTAVDDTGIAVKR